jgi:hypothetical protein
VTGARAPAVASVERVLALRVLGRDGGCAPTSGSMPSRGGRSASRRRLVRPCAARFARPADLADLSRL